MIDALGPAAGTLRPEEPFFVCDFIQARDPALVQRLFFAAYDPEVTWFNQLRPAFCGKRFEGDHERALPLHRVTECVLN